MNKMADNITSSQQHNQQQQQQHQQHSHHHQNNRLQQQKSRLMSNFIVRSLFTLIMVFLFGLLIWIGPIALICIVLIIQVKCFQEIIAIGYSVYRVHGLKWFRSLSWYFLLASNYFIFGESLVGYFLLGYHRFISFCLYLIGFVWFVLSLEKRYYMRQFSLVSYIYIMEIFPLYILEYNANRKTIHLIVTILVCMDSCNPSDICYSILSNNSEPL